MTKGPRQAILESIKSVREQLDDLKEKIPAKNKYHAKRTYSDLCGRMFDSKAEKRRGEELALLERAGEIQDLDYQILFKLCDKPKITVTIDFTYEEMGKGKRRRIYEDVKGVLTRDSRTKYAWLEQRFGIHVNIIR